MTITRGIWHGEAWDREPSSGVDLNNQPLPMRMMRQERDRWQQQAWQQRGEIERLQADVARMKHVMDQRAEIIREMRKALTAKHVPPVRPVLPWEPWRSY